MSWRTPFRVGVFLLLALMAAELFTLSDDRLIGSRSADPRSRVGGRSQRVRPDSDRMTDAEAMLADALGADCGEEDALDRMALDLLAELVVPSPLPQTCCRGGNEAPGAGNDCACCAEQNETGPKTPKTVTARLEPVLGHRP